MVSTPITLHLTEPAGFLMRLCVAAERRRDRRGRRDPQVPGDARWIKLLGPGRLSAAARPHTRPGSASLSLETHLLNPRRTDCGAAPDHALPAVVRALVSEPGAAVSG